MGDWEQSRQLYAEATAWFVALTEQVGDRWEAPGLGEWDVRALVGHTSRSLLTVEEYLARPAAGVDIGSTVAYYLATSALSACPCWPAPTAPSASRRSLAACGWPTTCPPGCSS